MGFGEKKDKKDIKRQTHINTTQTDRHTDICRYCPVIGIQTHKQSDGH